MPESPGRPPKLSNEQMEELSRLVEAGPDPEKDRFSRWRCADLKRVLGARFAVDLSKVSLGRILRKLGFSHISARPRHPKQDPEAIASFKKDFPTRVFETMSRLALGTAIEVWFQDEMRVGQKNSLVYQWAKKGTRPRQPKDQRYENAYLFGAVCPSRDTGAAIIMPYANTAAMRRHLKEISDAVAPGAHAMVILDQAGWHTTRKLKVPNNLTMVSLPPACPELNAAENIWQYCARPTSPTGYSKAMPTFSMLARTPGKGSSTRPVELPPSPPANGQPSVKQYKSWYKRINAGRLKRTSLSEFRRCQPGIATKR